jgi:Protein of unknown function (DUF3999)
MTSAFLSLVIATSAASPRVGRSIEVRHPGRIAVVLDADVYDAARRDLADLRVVDDLGGETPYVLDRVALDLSGDNFRYRGEGDPERIETRGAEARPAGRPEAPSVPLTPVLGREEDPKHHETLLVLELPARNQPFRSIALDVADPHFMRGVVVEARVDPVAPRVGEVAQPVVWTTVGEGCVYRYDEGARRIESQRLDVQGRARVIRLRVRNRDDRPLDIRGVALTAPVERLLFEALKGRQYRLTYGLPELGPPTYDLGRTVGDLEAWGTRALEARLGAVERRSQAPGARPWTERHPGLLWTGLFAAVAILGMITWRALGKSA